MISIQNLFTSKAKSKISPLYFVFTAAILLLFASIQPIQAQQSSVTFAQFFERNGTNDFVFTNNGGSNATFQTVAGGSPVFFLYQNIPGLPAELQGIQNATLLLSSNVTQAAANNNDVLTQPLDQTTVITIFRDTPATVGSGSRRNLLTVSFSPNQINPLLTGANEGNSATFSATTSPASPDHNVVFTSDFLRFDATTQRNLAFSFSSVLPQLARGLGNYLDNFTAAGSGTFASDTPPVYNPPPTAATAIVSGRVTNAAGNGLGRVRVTVINQSGASVATMTNFSGYFRFSNIVVGQNYIFTASSHSYEFVDPVRLLFVTNDYDQLNFSATR